MYDISQSYYPMVLELRETAVELNESLEVFNNRVVLNEIPDTFMKVYISGFVEIEESKTPKQGEYVVDYKTGIITMDGKTPDNTIVNVSYYGLGIIQYPADRIYSHNPNPEVAGSLQRILDRGEEAITELNITADISKRQSHASNNSFFANQDWTRVIKKLQGDGQLNYNATTKGIEISGEMWLQVNVRIPVEPESKYWVRAKVKKTVGDGKFYLGAISLDNNYEEMSTDQAKSYNYFGTANKTIVSGSTEMIEGYISGYNTTSGTSANKFDPEAKYFDLVIIANYQATADITKTVIEWLEVYRSPKSMHVQGSGSFGGDVDISGITNMYKELNMNNNDINRIKVLNGEYGNIAKSTDEWLRINDGGGHTTGVYFGSSLIRTDGILHIGSNGSVLNVTSGILNYRNLLSVDATRAIISTPSLSITGDVDIDKTLNVDGISTFRSPVSINGNLTMTNGTFDLERSSSIAVMLVKNNSTGELARFGSTADTGKLIIRNDGSIYTKGDAEIVKGLNVGQGLDVTGATILRSTLAVSGATNLSSNLFGSGNAEFLGKIWAGKNTTYGSTPIVTLAIGDADTGLNWNADGVIDLMANNSVIAQYSATKFDINKKLNAKASLSVTGNLDVSNDVIITNQLTSGSTSVGSLIVRSGGTVTVNSNTTFNSPIDLTGNTLNNVDAMNFKEGGFVVDVNSLSRIGGTGDTYHIYATAGQIKLWRPTYIVGATDITGNTSISGNLTITGTVDGVDVSAFKSAYDIHHHDASYVNVDGDAMTGGLKISQNVNNPSLILEGATTGWASGIQLKNTTPTTGKTHGIYSSSAGNLLITQEGGIGAMLGFSSTGSATFYASLTVNGTATLASNLSVGGSTTHSSTTTLNGVVNLNNDMIVATGKAIRPATPEGATLGTPSHPFQDVYIGANSLYVDGKKVVSSQADTIDISTDIDQHMSINTSGLGTTRLASGKEVVVYSGQLVTLQSGGNMSLLGSGLLSLKSDVSGSGIELVSQSALGNINITSGNRIEFNATGDISFLKTPKVNGNLVQLASDSISASRITQTSSLRFVTDSDKNNWNGKVNRAGDTMTGFLTLHADPTSPLHAVTKQYVDAVKQSLDIKESVKVATTGNITLSGGQTIDGVVLSVGDRVLVKDQTDAKQNGIWQVQSGAWTRPLDFDNDSDVTSGAFVFVEQGSAFGNMGFVLVTDGTINIGVTPINFTQFSGAGQVINGTGLYKTGNEIGLTNTVSAGSYRTVTVNAQGRVTAGSNPTTLSGYGITDALNKAGDVITGTLNLYSTGNGIRAGGVSSTAVVIYASGGGVYLRPNTDSGDGEFIVNTTELRHKGLKVWTEYNMGSGSGLDADKIDGLQASQFMRSDTNTTTTGTLTANRLVGKQNGFTVTIPTGQTKVTLTHNFGNTNYKATLGVYSVNRHAGLSNKLANTIDIEIDDVYTSDITIDVILMPIL